MIITKSIIDGIKSKYITKYDIVYNKIKIGIQCVKVYIGVQRTMTKT